ncbi:MAG: hypothetical protein ACK415_05965 [Thermodesulfovibrionales bacterium]
MVLLNETKSTPRINYIDDFIVALKEFYDYFPEYRGKKVVPIFASLYLQEEVINYLTKKPHLCNGNKGRYNGFVKF